MAQPALAQFVHRMRGIVSPRTDSDGALLRAFHRRRDQDAFAVLLDRHSSLVYGACRRVLRDPHAADDVFQATFLVLVKKAESLRLEQPLGPWLYTVASRLAAKARNGRRQYSADSLEQIAAPDPDHDQRELIALLDEELLRLPERLRAPLVLCYLQGQTRDEAARSLGLTVATLKRRLESGRALLRSRLAQRSASIAGIGLVVLLADSPVQASLRESTIKLALDALTGENAPVHLAPLVASGLADTSPWWTWRAAAIVLLALGAITGGVMAFSGRVPEPPRRAEAPKIVEPARDVHNDLLPASAVARFGTIAFRHGDATANIAYSPDGKLILSQCWRFARVWDAATGRELASFARPEARGSLVAASFSPNGKQLIVVHDDQRAFIIDIAAQVEVKDFSLKGDGVRRFQTPIDVFSPDGKFLAHLEGDTSVRIWDMAARKPRALCTAGGKKIVAMTFTNDGKTLVTADDEPRFHVFEAASGKELLRFAGEVNRLGTFAVSPDGRWLVTVGQTAHSQQMHGGVTATHFRSDSSVKIWDVTKGAVVRQIEAARDGVCRAWFAPDGTLFTSGYGTDNTLRSWDVTNGKRRSEFARHGGMISSIAFTPDGKTLATSAGGILRQWNFKDASEQRPLAGHLGAVSSAALSGDGSSLLTISADGFARTWDLKTGASIHAFDAGQGYLYDCALSPDGNRFATVIFNTQNPVIQLRNAKTGKLERELKDHGKAVSRLAISPDGQWLAAGDYDATVRLWDLNTGAQVRVLKAPSPWLAGALRFSPDSRTLFGASIDDAVCIWNAVTGDLLKSWRPHELGIMKKVLPGGYPERSMGLAFSRDGEMVAFGVQGQPRIVVCATRTGNVVRTINGLDGTPVSLAISSDGKRIASGTWEGPVHLWDLEDGKHLKSCTGHRGRVLKLLFTADGKQLISTSEDSTALAWSVK